jgi:hypothetical protein
VAISRVLDQRGRLLRAALGFARSPTSATGTGWERTPWHATQRAAWEALLSQSESSELAKTNSRWTP